MNDIPKAEMLAVNRKTMSNITLMLFVALCVLCSSFVQDNHIASKVFATVGADYCLEHTTDSASEDDLGNDSNDITNSTAQYSGVFATTSLTQNSLVNSLTPQYLRPLNRAPPKVFA